MSDHHYRVDYDVVPETGELKAVQFRFRQGEGTSYARDKHGPIKLFWDDDRCIMAECTGPATPELLWKLGLSDQDRQFILNCMPLGWCGNGWI